MPSTDPDQVPPASGVPDKASNNTASVRLVPSQTVSVLSVPALGASSSITVTIEVSVSDAHAPVIATVYVYI